jgi:chromosome segregation ATPase
LEKPRNFSETIHSWRELAFAARPSAGEKPMGLPSLHEDIEDRRQDNAHQAQTKPGGIADFRESLCLAKSPAELQRLEIRSLKAELEDARQHASTLERNLRTAMNRQANLEANIRRLETENNELRRAVLKLKDLVVWHKEIEQKSIVPLRKK